MSLLQAIVLGIVQGLTEFLPISSSGHLIVVPWLLGWDQPGLSFDAALHLGTLVAVVAYFWRDLLAMLQALPRAVRHPHALLSEPASTRERFTASRDTDARLALLIALGTIPGLLAGFFGEAAIDRYFHSDANQSRTIAIIAIALILLALLLWAAERSAAHQRHIHHLTWRDALAIGLAQATALVPGVSRSGATITAGLFHGLHRADAARFSFLLGTPLVLGAGLKSVISAIGDGMTQREGVAFAAGGLTSAFVGFVAIWGLLRFLQHASTRIFILYRVVLGLSLLGLVASGFR